MFKKLEPLSASRHGGLKLSQSPSYSFASGLMFTELVAAELSQAAQNFPLAFTKQGDQTNLGALLSIAPGRNPFVGKGGQWLGGYVPAALRSYPFVSGPPDAKGDTPIFIDIESGRFSTKSGQDLFTQEGNPSEPLQQIMGFLGQLATNRQITGNACAMLDNLKLLVPWQIQIAAEKETASLTGLLRVDEAALNALPPEDFLQLRQSGALPLAYAQLLSMGRITLLGTLAKQQEQTASKGKQILGKCFKMNTQEGNTFKF